MVEYLFGSIFVAVIGVALVMWLAVLARRAILRQRELESSRNRLDSQQQLEEFIRRIDQVASDEELDHLDRKEKRCD